MLPLELISIIVEYSGHTRFIDGIEPEQLCLDSLRALEADCAVDFILKNIHLIGAWAVLRNKNPRAVAWNIEHVHEISYGDHWIMFTYGQAELIEYIIAHHQDMITSSGIVHNNSTAAVQWTIENSYRLCEASLLTFATNDNPIAVQWIINKHPELTKSIAFAKNRCDMAVQWMINHDGGDMEAFNMNPNQMAVDWLIGHPEKIRIKYFARNHNHVAIEWVLEHSPDDLDWQVPELQQDPLNAEWLLQHESHIIPHLFASNPNENAIKWCIEKKILWLSDNKNPVAVHWLLKNRPDKINWRSISKNPAIICPDDTVCELLATLI